MNPNAGAIITPIGDGSGLKPADLRTANHDVNVRSNSRNRQDLRFRRLAHGLLVVLLSATTATMAAAPVLQSGALSDDDAVSLRLDRTSLLSREPLAESQGSTSSVSRPADASRLHVRVLREGADARALAARVAEQAVLVEEREQRAAELQRLLARQDQLIGALQTLLHQTEKQGGAGEPPPVSIAITDSQAAPAEPAPVAAVIPATVTAPAEPAPPAAQPALRSASPAVEAESFSLAGFSSLSAALAALWPPSTELLIQAGALLLVLSLGCVLVLRSRQAGSQADDKHKEQVAEQGFAEPEPADESPLRERLRLRRSGGRVAPDLVNADLEPLEMPSEASPASNTSPSPGPGPLAGASGRAGTETRLLKEVDTLIAFEDYERAAKLLREEIEKHPKNPEYRLRLLHIESAMGNVEASEVEEEILAGIMMDGPLSATINRVLRAGRELLPGHPLFEAAQLDPAGDGEVPPVDRTRRMVPATN